MADNASRRSHVSQLGRYDQAETNPDRALSNGIPGPSVSGPFRVRVSFMGFKSGVFNRKEVSHLAKLKMGCRKLGHNLTPQENTASDTHPIRSFLLV